MTRQTQMPHVIQFLKEMKTPRAKLPRPLKLVFKEIYKNQSYLTTLSILDTTPRTEKSQVIIAFVQNIEKIKLNVYEFVVNDSEDYRFYQLRYIYLTSLRRHKQTSLRLSKVKQRLSHASVSTFKTDSTRHLCPLSKDPTGPSRVVSGPVLPDSLTQFPETGSRFSVSLCSLFPFGLHVRLFRFTMAKQKQYTLSFSVSSFYFQIQNHSNNKNVLNHFLTYDEIKHN
ncbi:Hypothetical_protein [Hexamita inflata]|uniref:Hypothetical_protein n=1 Tax=Hexamita inflata TaxID=28002 RepID=A0AA86PQU9_9EUKA|nr:Hypothetical protein HINF_LOCUS27009 [Hexamita inflata]